MKCNLGPTENLTVGQLFELSCQSDSELTDLHTEKLDLRLGEADQYKLKIIQAEKFSPTEMKLTLASYKVGQHELKALQVVDGDQSYVLGDLSFTVTSVMNPQEPTTEPYPSQGPLGVHLPIWYWAVAVFIILAVGFQIYWKIRQRKVKRKLLQDMQIDQFAASPIAQFFQSSRKIQRQYSFFSSEIAEPAEVQKFVEELASAYKLFLARLYRVPTFFWSEGKILNDIKKNNRFEYTELGRTFRKDLAELSRAQKAQGKMSAQDCRQLSDLIRKHIDQIEAIHKSGGKQ